MAKKLSKKVRPRSLTYLIGVEYQLLKDYGEGVKSKFILTASLLIIIFLITTISVWYAIDQLFHNIVFEIFFSLFFSGLFLLIYIFLLNTFSKESIKVGKRFFAFSNISRFLFLVFMTFIISKPIEIILFNKYISARAETYKEEMYSSYTQKINSLIEIDLEELQRKKTYWMSQNRLHHSSIIEASLAKIDKQILDKNAKRSRYLVLSKNEISQADCFLFKIKVTSNSYVGWFVCLLILVVFITPGYLIYNISGNAMYYKKKKELEQKIITDHYKFFNEEYHKLFTQLHGLKIYFYSKYEDPPYNTIRNSESSSLGQKDFIKKFQ